MRIARFPAVPCLWLLPLLPLLACGDEPLPPAPAAASVSALAAQQAIPSFEEQLEKYRWTTIKIPEQIAFSQSTDVRTWLAQTGRASQDITGPIRLMFSRDVFLRAGVSLTSDVPLFISTPATLTLSERSAITGTADLFFQVSKLILPPSASDRMAPYVGISQTASPVVRGSDGTAGTQGSSATCSPTQPPVAGGDGGPGGTGPKGQDSADVYFWVSQLIPYPSFPSPVLVGTDGKPGAQGGVGGAGGGGGNGVECPDFSFSGAKGGRGGVGGKGGDGGKAGNITVYYMNKERSNLRFLSLSAEGGKPGAAGEAGLPGAGGQPGSSGGQPGAHGAPGTVGTAGLPGSSGTVTLTPFFTTAPCCAPPGIDPPR